MRRRFTVAEANALLPRLRPQVERLMAAWARLRAAQAEVAAAIEARPHGDLGGGLLAQAAGDTIAVQDALAALRPSGTGSPSTSAGATRKPGWPIGIRCTGATAAGGRWARPEAGPPPTGARPGLWYAMAAPPPAAPGVVDSARLSPRDARGDDNAW